MPDSRQTLFAKLTKARQALIELQRQVTELEASLAALPDAAPRPNVLLDSVSHERVLGNLLEGFQVIGFDWRYLYLNESAIRSSGQTREALLGNTVMAQYPGIESTDLFAAMRRCMETRIAQDMALEFIFPDGGSAWFEFRIQSVPEGIFILSLDITERKRAEQLLRNSEEHLRSLVEGVKDYAIYRLDADGRIASWNAGAETLKGYRSDEIVGRPYADFFTIEDQQNGQPQNLLAIATAQGHIEGEVWRVRKDGSRFWASISITASRNVDGALAGFVEITRDLTQRKNADDLIRQLYRTLGVLSDINQAIVRIRYLPALFERACQIAVEKGFFRMALIAMFDPQTRRINPVASAGVSGDYLEKLNIVVADNDPRGYGPGATAVRTGKRVVISHIETDPTMLPWRADALRLGYRSLAVFPLIVTGEVRGAISLYAVEPDFFNADEIKLLDEMAMDISFAMAVAEREEQRQMAEATVKRYAQRMEILHNLDSGIIEANSIEGVIETALNHMLNLFQCQQVNLVLFDLNANEALIFAAAQSAPSVINKGDRFPLSAQFLEDTSANAITVIDDLLLLPDSSTSYQRIKKEGMRASLRARLTAQEQPMGTLILNAIQPAHFTAEHQEIIVEIANQMAIAIQQMRLTDELTRRSQSLEEAGRFLQATLDAFPANTTVLAPDGTILTINLPWKRFAAENGADASQYLGANYLTICDAAVGPMSEESESAAAGIRAVIAGQQDEFNLEYPCNSPNEVRWFMLRVIPFAEPAPRRVVVAHINITPNKNLTQAEREQRLLAEALRDSLAALTTTSDIETVMVQILAYSASVIPSEAGSIILFNGDEGRLAYSRGFSAEANTFFEEFRFTRDIGKFSSTAEGYTPYLIEDTRTAAGWTALPFTDWIRSSIGVPIVLHDEFIGLLVADSRTPHRFQPHDLANLQAFARYAALALENTRHVEQLEQRVRKRTAELQAAKDQVEAILNNSLDGILLLSADLHIRQTNTAFNRLFACEPDDYRNRSLLDLLDDMVADQTAATLRATIDQHTAPRIEIHAKRKDGTTFEAELGIGFIKADGFVCAIQDITERKAQERQLRYQASLQENVSDAVIVTDMALTIHSWNPAAERIYGWRAEEVLGKKTTPIFRSEFIDPGEREREVQLLRERGWWQGEMAQHHKDGHLIHVLRSITYIKDEDGRPFSIVSISYDVTDRKRAENELAEERNRLRALIDTITDMIYIKDTEHRFVLCNQAAAVVHGYRTADELINKSDFDHYPPAMAEHLRAREAEMMRSGQPMIEEEEFLNGFRGIMWVSSSKFPLRNLNGALIGLVGITRDISERKRSETLLQQALSKEKELNELKSRFVSMASHEFRTPLATILAASETLNAYRHRMTDTQIERRLGNIREQVEYLKSIMDDVLYLARLEARRSDFNPVPVNLDALCRSIIDEFQSRPDINHEIRFTGGDPVRETTLDVKLMRQIISNLVSNAIKYSPRNKIVTVSLEYTAEALILKVSDSGIGIPESDLKYLFEAFHRATNVGTISGTGLGLVITKESVERHGGIITVESHVDQGTTFTVNIPISATKDSPA